MSRARQKQHKRLVLIARSNKFINRLIDAGRVQADRDGFAFDSAEDGLEYLYWDNLFADYPTEVVNIDENGKYDKEKSPKFHDWMVNG